MKAKKLRFEIVALVLSLTLMALGPVVDDTPYQQLEGTEVKTKVLDKPATKTGNTTEINIEEDSGESMVLDNG